MDLDFLDQITFSEKKIENDWYKNFNFRQFSKIILTNENSFL